MWEKYVQNQQKPNEIQTNSIMSKLLKALKIKLSVIELILWLEKWAKCASSKTSIDLIITEPYNLSSLDTLKFVAFFLNFKVTYQSQIPKQKVSYLILPSITILQQNILKAGGIWTIDAMYVFETI